MHPKSEESCHSGGQMKRKVDPSVRPKIAVSACLLGQKVRFDGGHKQSRLVKDLLGEVCDLIPLCPEVGIGMSTPREPIRLVRMSDGEIRARGSKRSDTDVTDQLRSYVARVAPLIEGVSGYVFMQKSPSCGLFRVKMYGDDGRGLFDKGRGIYADELCRRFPLLPKEEAGRLCDPVLFENFVTRVFTQHEWALTVLDDLSHAKLSDFHARHKLLLMSHSPAACQAMGGLVANHERVPLPQLASQYHQMLMTTLKRKATRRSHSHALLYMARFLKHWLAPERKREWRTLVEQYRNGIVPLIVPLTLAKHYVNEHPDSFLGSQVYLQPHPLDLGLRNAI